MIDTREELLAALREASEIEHGLLVQYLFAALTMKKHLDEGITPDQQRSAREWERIILRVAVDEMGHFGTVCNLLSAIGGAPNFNRPNFPLEKGYYPFSFDLVRFSDEALYRFQVFELPRGMDPPLKMLKPAITALDNAETLAAMAVAPDPLVYNKVGELYQQIAEGFREIPENELFVGPDDAQSPQRGWSVDLDIHIATDLTSALEAIEDIIVDGEGSPEDRAGSHFNQFTRIRREFFDMGNFDAARNVVRNPLTRHHREADIGGTILENRDARAVAELCNSIYALTMLMLQQYFRYGGETPRQREALQQAAQRTMSTAIRPVVEVLTEMPFGTDEEDPRRAGPGFELYDDISVSPFLDARWTILLERFNAVSMEARRLSDINPRLQTIGETLAFIRRALANAANGE